MNVGALAEDKTLCNWERDWEWGWEWGWERGAGGCDSSEKRKSDRKRTLILRLRQVMQPVFVRRLISYAVSG